MFLINIYKKVQSNRIFNIKCVRYLNIYHIFSKLYYFMYYKNFRTHFNFKFYFYFEIVFFF